MTDTTTPHYQDGPVTLHHGDCLDVLRTLPDESVHAVVTDPPYGLSNTDPGHVSEAITHWTTGDRTFLPSAGGGFMGKAWDEFVPPPAVWDECMRVLKPGGHLLAFAGSRTVDLMALSIRLAGFDIRDSIAWMYGSGFPKSLDVSKAIDKAQEGAMRRAKLAHFIAARGVDAQWIVAQGVADSKSFADWTTEGHAPSDRNWALIREALGVTSDEEAAFERTVVGARPWTNSAQHFVPGADHAERVDVPVTTAATEEARAWEGWGTALKPAFEPIVVARKPLAGTVAANVLAHGTGALNIDASRVAWGEGGDKSATRKAAGYSDAARKALGKTVASESATGFSGEVVGTDSSSGRWPANVVLEQSQAEALGSPSALFPTFRYEAKAPTSERPVVGGVAHPTVKPLDLMRWLVRLVTPKGGTVLEPFAGSGTTVEACIREGFDVVAIEREADYLPLIEKRIRKDHAQGLDFDWGDA